MMDGKGVEAAAKELLQAARTMFRVAQFAHQEAVYTYGTPSEEEQATWLTEMRALNCLDEAERIAEQLRIKVTR